MSPDLIWLCCVLTAGLFLAWAWRGAAREDRLRFQQTAADAARRTEDDVRRDLAAAKAARDLVEQLAFDIAFAKITATEFPTIPQQTRRTEEPQ